MFRILFFSIDIRILQLQLHFINICNSMKSFSLAHDSVREKIDTSVEWPSNAFLLGVFQSQYRELNLLFYLKGRILTNVIFSYHVSSAGEQPRFLFYVFNLAVFVSKIEVRFFRETGDSQATSEILPATSFMPCNY